MSEGSESPREKDSPSNHESEHYVSTEEAFIGEINERRLLRKVDIRVLPITTVIYVLAFLDRVNIGNALLYGLPADLHLEGTQLNTALCIFFVSYCVFEIPATLLMKKLGPHVFLSLSMFLCGVLGIAQGFVRNFGGLVTVRFILGIVEAGIFPGCFYLIGMWYRRPEAQKRFSFFFNAASVAGAFGSLLASAIGLMDGIRGYYAWRWVFILEGCLTCVVSALAYLIVTDFPENARWLKDNERAFIVRRLRADQGNSGIDNTITLAGILQAFSDWKMILGALMYFGPTVSAYGLAYFIPSIVQTYGFKPIEAQLHAVIPWAAAMVFAMLIAFASDRTQSRFPFIVLGLCLALCGNLVLLTVHSNREAEFAGLALYTMGVIGILPIVVCWFSMNLVGHTNRSVGTAWQIGFGNTAGIVATFAFPSNDKPRYYLGYSLGLGFLCVGGGASLAYYVACLREKKLRVGERRVVL